MHPELAAPYGASVFAHLHSRLRSLLFVNLQIHINFILAGRASPSTDSRRSSRSFMAAKLGRCLLPEAN